MKARTMATMLCGGSHVSRSSSSLLGSGDGFDLQEVRKHDAILERLGHPDEVQRVLVDADLLREQSGVVGAEEAAAVRVDADAEVADADFEHRLSDNVGNSGCDAGVDLCRVICGCIVVIVEGYEEDTRDQRTG